MKLHKKRIQEYLQLDLRYIISGGFWLTTGQTAVTLSSLVVAYVFANYADPQTFGTYKYVLSMAGLLTIPTLRGINHAYTQAVARGYEGGYSHFLRVRIRWGLFGSLGSIILSLYYFYNGNDLLGISFLIVSFFIPFFETFGFYTSLLQGRRMFRESAKYVTVSRLIPLPILCLTIYYSGDLFLILLSYFLPLTLTQFVLERHTTLKHQPNEQVDDSVLSYGKHISIAGAFTGATRYFDTLILFTFINAPAVAIYTLAAAASDQIIAQYKSLPALIMPKLASKSGQDIHSTFWKRLSLLSLLSFGVACLYVLLTPIFFEWFFPNYTSSIIYAQLLSVVLFLSLPSSFIGGLVQSRLDITPKNMLYWRILPRAVFVISLLLLVPFYGILGAVLSRIIMSVVTIINQFTQYSKLIKIER